MKRLFWLPLVVVVGCGSMQPPEVKGPQQGIPGATGPQGPQGEQGIPGDPGDSSLLSWAVFDGNPPVITFSTGGPVSVLSFTRFGVGDYRIVYDIPTLQVGIVAAVATAIGHSLSTGANAVFLVGTRQDANAFLLTIDVFTVSTFVDVFSLTDSDTIFSLVIYGE